ncbi:ABC transporter permease [Acerihabitans arboris]|uniref:ABC transporter permease subunit n=1 Tax=Acerihabitans arboris TaxID=2691583 RepID=A0A845SER2_9GAMM|nr:ABC transporter permease [Acerihabitans arboris]NDL61857.1 ABC transporter permease subunit [Acerihabitans arboris]
MLWYAMHRLLALIPVLLVVAVVVFCLVHLAPGDPVLVILGNDARPEDILAMRDRLGLNRPLIEQFWLWFSRILQGDLGRSLFMQESVASLFTQHLKPTLSLALLAQSMAMLLGILGGIAAAYRRGRFTDRLIMGLSTFGLSIPGFLLGLFLIFFFAVHLRWFPVIGYKSDHLSLWQNLYYLCLPALALAIRIAALLARMTRAVMLDVLNENYIKTARAKGVSERAVLLRHAFKNAWIPVLNICGESFGSLVTGAIVIESVFGIPGVGSLIIDSIERRDFTVIQGSVLLITTSYVLINLVVDLSFGFIDPRINVKA